MKKDLLSINEGIDVGGHNVDVTHDIYTLWSWVSCGVNVIALSCVRCFGSERQRYTAHPHPHPHPCNTANETTMKNGSCM